MNRSHCSVLLAAMLAVQASAAMAGIPPGYYDPAAGLSGEALRSALHDIIDDHSVISYDDVWLAFYTTDDKPGGMVWDMYSDVPGGTPPYEYTLGEDQGGSASGEGEGYNREHTWPQSWFGGAVPPMNSDMFQIVPTDIYVNNRRGNFPYGEVASPTWVSLNGSLLGPCAWPGYAGTVFEPRPDFKGDLARNFFYMTTRYYGEDAAWPGSPMTDGSQLLDWAVGLLISWHLEDPVSAKELERNEAVYAIQDNRNPFIDHPEFVTMIYYPTYVGEDEDLPVQQPVLAVSPNPSAGAFILRLELPEAALVDLGVFDPSGRLVRVLLDDSPMDAGTHELVFDGNGGLGGRLPSGVYFGRLATPSAVSACALLIL